MARGVVEGLDGAPGRDEGVGLGKVSVTCGV